MFGGIIRRVTAEPRRKSFLYEGAFSELATVAPGPHLWFPTSRFVDSNEFVRHFYVGSSFWMRGFAQKARHISAHHRHGTWLASLSSGRRPCEVKRESVLG